MAFTIEKQFTVHAPRDAVWDFLTDPHRVARCLPGASITEQIDEHNFAGKINIKVGPVSTSYKGKITFDRLDRDAGTAEMSGRGQDVRGRGGADMRMTSQLTEHGDATEVRVTSEVNVTGILAQFGRGMIQDVSDQMFQTFTDRLQHELADEQGPPATASQAVDSPSDAESLDVGSIAVFLVRRFLGRLRRPLFWIALAVGAIIAYALLIR